MEDKIYDLKDLIREYMIKTWNRPEDSEAFNKAFAALDELVKIALKAVVCE